MIASLSLLFKKGFAHLFPQCRRGHTEGDCLPLGGSGVWLQALKMPAPPSEGELLQRHWDSWRRVLFGSPLSFSLIGRYDTLFSIHFVDLPGQNSDLPALDQRSASLLSILWDASDHSSTAKMGRKGDQELKEPTCLILGVAHQRFPVSAQASWDQLLRYGFFRVERSPEAFLGGSD